MTDRRMPSEAEVQSWIRERHNWGRWGPDDQRGTINLITPAKRVEAARLCRTGRSVSLSRPFPKEPGINNAFPAQHFMRTMARGKGGAALDYYGIFYHGVASTPSTPSATRGTSAPCGTAGTRSGRSPSTAPPSARSSTGGTGS